MRRTTFATALRGLLVGAALAAPAAAYADTRLRIALPSDIRSTDPGVNRDGNTDWVVSHIVEGLVGHRDDASVAPMLAESYTASADGKTYTFKLRSGIIFQNGKPLTSADVLWTWNRYMDPKTSWRCFTEFDGSRGLKVDKVEASDDLTVVFTLNQPNSLFLANMARPDCGQTGIYQKESVGADGKWIKPIGTGPFALAKREPGRFIDLDKFAGYKARSEPKTGLVGDKTPQVDHVRFLVVPDSSAAKAGLLAGDIDVLFDVENQDVAEMKANPEVKVDEVPGFGIVGYLFQTKDPVLNDVRMRQAIKLSLDAPEVVDAVTVGLAKPNQSVIPPGSAFYSKVMATPFEHNIEKAKQLVKQAGYDGKPIMIMASKQQPQLFEMAVMAQAMMAQVGIKSDIEVLDWATQLDRYNAGKFQMMAFSYSARLDPSLSYDMMAGDKAEQPRKVWDNPEQRKLLAETMAITDDKKRQALFDQIETMFQKEVPMIPLYSGSRVGAVRKNVDGYASWSVGSPRAWGVSVGSGK
ncbi:peptide/nickel transport system substrate-binding protein [Neorhizobium galegae]|uniref:ABC transporter substrate-binding protein n=1 Tax=Neorhizobium galegae TaxID=399 RepID=UPI001AE67C68|nr:ABC transporter substrate-binding protein [Neorhizobium galegae]MBP2563170.1 peptide/nickel transport system substrate-binding protein [Neorhizobium galegae]